RWSRKPSEIPATALRTVHARPPHIGSAHRIRPYCADRARAHGSDPAQARGFGTLMRGTSACDNQAETDAAASPLGRCHGGPGGARGLRVGRRRWVVVVRMVDSVSDSVETTSRDTTTVGVRVPAEHEQLVMLRALAEMVALIADFGLDEVTDTR